jgi:hypothetical protein
MMTMPFERLAIARRLADAFNQRRIDDALALLTEDVDWPNVAEGRRLHGREAVREYWLAQWEEVEPRVEPLEFEAVGDRLVLTVHQRVTDKSGAELVDHMIAHVLTFDGDLVSRLDVHPGKREALESVAG